MTCLHCAKPVHGRGLCGTHYARWRRTGNPAEPHVQVRKQDAAYVTVHGRLKRDRGSASGFPCAVCGAPARWWSYNGSGVDERLEVRADGIEVVYSTDTAQYDPCCIPCAHKRDRPRTRKANR